MHISKRGYPLWYCLTTMLANLILWTLRDCMNPAMELLYIFFHKHHKRNIQSGLSLKETRIPPCKLDILTNPFQIIQLAETYSFRFDLSVFGKILAWNVEQSSFFTGHVGSCSVSSRYSISVGKRKNGKISCRENLSSILVEKDNNKRKLPSL